MNLSRFRVTAAALLLAAVGRFAFSAEAEYRPYAARLAALREAVTRAGPAAGWTKLSDTAGKQEVWVLTLAAASAVEPDKRPAILLVGGADADYPTGTETAFRVAERLIEGLVSEPGGAVAKLLERRTVYVVGCLDPEGYDAMFAAPQFERRVNGRPIDDDRDGVADEDGPNDLNGDGRITVMRVRDPLGEWMIDPDEPRLMKKADRAKGQRGEYRLLVEGIDDDGDGQINEDGPGGVDCDRNWPHLFEPGTAEAGIVPLSEAQTRALADFVLAHRNIVLACVYGRNDNIVQPAKANDKQPDGKPYRDMHPDDRALYDHVSERFKKTTGLTSSTGGKPEGAFYSWMYAQQGVFTLAITPWVLPESAASQPATGPASASAGEGAAGDTRTEASGGVSPAGAPPGGRAGGRGGRGRGMGGIPGGAPGGGGPPGQGVASEAAAARETGAAGQVESTDANKKWLAYNDRTAEKAGFVVWTAVRHPEFGEVEVGGLAPYFRTTAPAAELPMIADRQVSALLELSELLPAPGFGPAIVHDRGGGVWEVRVRLTNTGYLPTHTGMALHAQLPGWVIRPQIPPERLVGGRRVERIDNIPGSGGTAEVRWLVRGAAGEKVGFVAYSRVYGEMRTEVELKQAPGTAEVRP